MNRLSNYLVTAAGVFVLGVIPCVALTWEARDNRNLRAELVKSKTELREAKEAYEELKHGGNNILAPAEYFIHLTPNSNPQLIRMTPGSYANYHVRCMAE